MAGIAVLRRVWDRHVVELPVGFVHLEAVTKTVRACGMDARAQSGAPRVGGPSAAAEKADGTCMEQKNSPEGEKEEEEQRAPRCAAWRGFGAGRTPAVSVTMG